MWHCLPLTRWDDAIEAIRKLDEDFESIYYVYTLDPAGALTGVLSLRSLIVADHDARLNSLAYRDVVWVAPDEDQEDVAEEMSKYNLAAMPVCDENRHILGIVTVDDAMEVMSEEHQEDLQIAGMGASEGGSGESMHVFAWFARRQYWLLVWAIASGIVAAALEMLGSQGSLVLYPMCAMPVVLLTASRAVSFVRNYYLEYEPAEDGDKPYLGFFAQTTLVGAVLAVVIYLCGQLVLGAAYPEGVLAAGSGAEALSAELLSTSFALAALVAFASCALSVIYLKLLFWRDDRDLNTSGSGVGRLGRAHRRCGVCGGSNHAGAVACGVSAGR